MSKERNNQITINGKVCTRIPLSEAKGRTLVSTQRGWCEDMGFNWGDGYFSIVCAEPDYGGCAAIHNHYAALTISNVGGMLKELGVITEEDYDIAWRAEKNAKLDVDREAQRLRDERDYARLHRKFGGIEPIFNPPSKDESELLDVMDRLHRGE